jgi:hypothetical protein
MKTKARKERREGKVVKMGILDSIEIHQVISQITISYYNIAAQSWIILMKL